MATKAKKRKGRPVTERGLQSKIAFVKACLSEGIDKKEIPARMASEYACSLSYASRITYSVKIQKKPSRSKVQASA